MRYKVTHIERYYKAAMVEVVQGEETIVYMVDSYGNRIKDSYGNDIILPQ